ncbi:hypothetical protein D4764_17G0006810 [Takifugu flavidus]|uniref:Uncharacterized protein n=1 Tax=Takifugu flavidus TaxID=433684 RepID=A0A5C6NWI9_9TELE|nr:hypothetical protein D4764_17G0006810 [Takifugu flavidus]
MPKPPHLAPLNVEEQRLYSELLPDGRLRSVIHTLKKRDYNPGLPIQRHHPRCPRDVAESSQPQQPYNIQSLKELRADLIHPRGLATKEFFYYLGNFSPGDMRACPQVPRPCFLTGRRIGGIKEVLEMPDGGPEPFRSHPEVVLNGLTELFPCPGLCLGNRRSCTALGHAWNMVHSDSMSPASPGTWSKLSRRGHGGADICNSWPVYQRWRVLVSSLLVRGLHAILLA